MIRAQAIAIAAIIAAFLLAGCGQKPAPPAAPQTPTPSAAAPAQTVCPVMGGAIDKSIYVDYKGERVYFCCQSCIATFNKEPEKYLAKMRPQTPATN